MKKELMICAMLALAAAAAPAVAGDFATDNRTSVRLYGGMGANGPYVRSSEVAPEGFVDVSYDRTGFAVYGFSVSRDLLPRLALELDVQNAYRNTFPAMADYGEITGSDYQDFGIQDIPAVKDYIDGLIAEDGNPSTDWLRYNSLAVTLRPVFHVINTVPHRLSVYAGVGFHVTDEVGFQVSCFLPSSPSVNPGEYWTEHRQYHMVGLAGAAGVRYEYSFAEHYMVGIDLGTAFNDSEADWHKESSRLNWCDYRALLYLGFRF